MPHKLLHFLVNSKYQSYSVTWASSLVAQEVSALVERAWNVELRILVAGAEGVPALGAVRGLFFEAAVHRHLPRGGQFTLRDLLRHKDRKIAIAPLKELIFNSAAQLTTQLAAGVYARPKAKNFATIDAIVVPPEKDSPIMFLQMTVSSTHPIKAAVVQTLRDTLPSSLRSRALHFVFVVPEDVAPSFPLQEFHTRAGTVMQSPPSDVVQHVLIFPKN